jgi:uncharacterized protein YfiM (DUF2279 family)
MRGFALLFTMHFGRGAEPARDRWLGTDKMQHFLMAAFVESASFSTLRLVGLSRGGALVGAASVAGVASVGKEVYDANHRGDPSLKDLTWDAAGIVAAGVVLRRTER